MGHKIPRLSYTDVKTIMERRLANIRGGISEEEIAKVIKEWEDERTEEELDPEIVKREIKKLAEKFERYNVPALGDLPVEREDGTFRIMHTQLNSASSKEVRDIKVAECTMMVNKYDVNCISFNELGYNFTAVESSRNLASWFESDREMRCVTSNNEHDPALSRHQQGGVGMLCFHEYLQFARTTTKDPRRLGRICSWAFWANPSHKFRFVTAYQNCKSKPKGLKTIHQQHTRYIQDHNLRCSPRELFRQDLVKQLKQWRKEGDRILLVMDTNEPPGEELDNLLAQEGLEMEEFTHKYWGDTEPNTHISGTRAIDRAYRTKDVEVAYFLLCSFVESPGDHRTLLIDITTRSMLGEFKPKIVRPVGRRLVMSNWYCVQRYNHIVEEQFLLHRIVERMDAIENLISICGFPSPKWLQVMILKLHKQMDEIRIHAEKKCRKILKPDLPFSGPIQHWYDKIHAYQNLIKRLEGTTKNNSNIVRHAWRHGIDNPKSLTMDQLKDGLRLAQIRKRQNKPHAPGLRGTHLRDCLVRAEAKKDKVKVKAIRQKIDGEHTRKMWYIISRATKAPKSPAVLKVERVVNGRKVRLEDEEGVVDAIQGETEVRFTLAHSAPISKTLLAEKLRYLSNEAIALDIILGRYEIPDEMDEATALILREIGKMGMKIVDGGGRQIVVTPSDFKKFWRRVREYTSSSASGLHYSHYKAATHSEMITRVLSKQITVIVKSGVPPDRWSIVLQCMLEKIAGVILVEKLRSIQLYEADFNFFNQFVFGQEALSALVKGGFLPEEHFSQKESMAEDAKFDKTLTADLSRQARHPATVTSVDASNCYDRVNHVIMSLIWLALLGLVGFPPIYVALCCLQHMKFYQRTGFGDSKTFFGGLKAFFQGLGQGNRAAPASWLQLSSVLVNIYKSQGYGAKIPDPLTGEIIHSMGDLFVDDCDLFNWLESLLSAEEIWEETQDSILMWGTLLCASGGALKSEKCWWYLLDYEFVDGKWEYVTDVDYELFVPMPDGSYEQITREDVFTSKKTLGVWDCPAGGNAEHLKQMHDKMDVWIQRMKNGHVPSHMAWVAYRLQLWAGLRYGIGTMTNDVEAAIDCFENLDYEMLNVLGVAKTVKAGWRRLHHTFGGFGLFNLPTEQLICRLNLLVQHYDTSSIVSRKLKASLRYLQLQIGTNTNPFLLEYDKWSFLAPLSWVKMLWRTAEMTSVNIQMRYDEIPFPREGDELLMDVFDSTDPSEDDMKSFCRVRCSLGALFLSDIATSDGRKLEDFALSKDSHGDVNSSYRFPRECPTDRDWQVWHNFWSGYTDTGFALVSRLGAWKHPTHRTWVWFLDKDSGDLQCRRQGRVTHYIPYGRARTRSEQRYRVAWSEETTIVTGLPVSVKEMDGYVILPSSPGGPPLATGPSKPTDFWAFLRSWGGTWMWEGLQGDKEDLRWLIIGMESGSLIWVTDGSYDRKRAPLISGAGWLIHCTAAKKTLKGSFFEYSKNASSYRAELLGLCALHLFARALEAFFEVSEWSGKMCCDNESALNQASMTRRRVRPSSSCADILRSLRTSKGNISAQFTYEHVDSHMDRYKLWRQLTLEQQLNCICDNLAKSAVHRSIRVGFRVESYLLPLEDIAIVVNGEKMTSNFDEEIRFDLSRRHARQFLTTGLKTSKLWTEDQFDEVDWPMLHEALKGKPDGYKVWLSKQHTGFCGTRLQTARYAGDESINNSCPCCRDSREDAAHILLCPDEDRTKLLQESTEALEKWMLTRGNTYAEIAYWVPKYILCRGTRRFQDLGVMSPEMRSLAISQDKIGWRNFMEGRISRRFYSIQHFHLAISSISSSYLNGEDWTKKFISELLHITHSQWVYRNLILHDRQRGYLRLQEREAVQSEIERLMDTRPDEIPTESKFLLEFDYDRLQSSNVELQQYWVLAMKSARRAGRRVASRGARARRLDETRRHRISRRARLGVLDVEMQIRQDGLQHGATLLDEWRLAPLHENSPSEQQVHPSSIQARLKSNKRMRKPD